MATIIVEDGSNVPNANSYVSVADLEQYAADRGITLATTDVSSLIINGMDYIESLDYKGWPTYPNQSLKWPRSGIYITDGYCGCTQLPNNTIPLALKKGLMAVAVAVDQGSSPLSPVTPVVKSETVDVISVTYQDGAPSTTTNPAILTFLKPLLSGYLGGNIIKVSRG